MKYPYIVNKNGILYPAGADVPEDTKTDSKTYTKTYTKTEINRMSTSDLQLLASEQGVENATEKSGAELKRILIQLFEL